MTDETSVLQAVLDAIKGTLDPHTQIADHPNVKFAQMQRLKWMVDWFPIETAPYHTWVLAWLFLPKNPPASGCVIAQRVYVQRDDPDTYPEHQRQTVGCWWANGIYYAAGHVTHWMPLPAPPSDPAPGAVSLSSAVDPSAEVTSL